MLKIYSYIDLSFEQLSTLIEKNSVHSDDPHLAAKIIRTQTSNKYNKAFFLEYSNKQKIQFCLLKYAKQRNGRFSFRIYPSNDHSLIIALPNPVLFFIIVISIMTISFSLYFIFVPIILAFVLLLQINSELDEILNQLKTTYEEMDR